MPASFARCCGAGGAAVTAARPVSLTAIAALQPCSRVAICSHSWRLPRPPPSSSRQHTRRLGQVRTGGGFGAFEVAYWLEHEGTDHGDVTATAPYTTLQTVPFPAGAVAMTFKVAVHDDRVYEGDERFRLRLAEPTGSSSPVALGAQRSTTVTIRDNDQVLASAAWPGAQP